MMPFPGGIEAFANGALILSAIGALLYLIMLEQPVSWRRSVAKTAPVLLLAAVAVEQNASLLLIAALTLSAAGDYFLSRDGERFFLAGLVSFLAAHVAYIALFYGMGGGVGALAEPWRAALAIASVVLAAAVLRVLIRHVPQDMRVPVTVYCAAILLMALAALTTPNPLVIAGALSFMASDTLLAWERFVLSGPSPLRLPMRIAVWVLYYLAQALIVLGIAA